MSNSEDILKIKVNEDIDHLKIVTYLLLCELHLFERAIPISEGFNERELIQLSKNLNEAFYLVNKITDSFTAPKYKALEILREEERDE